jgi:hypothetical protein
VNYTITVPTNAHEHIEVTLYTPRTPTRFGQIYDHVWPKHVGSGYVYKLTSICSVCICWYWYYIYWEYGGAFGCGTALKAGLFPDCVNGIFHWRNSSGQTMALASTWPLTEMSTKNTSWRVKAAVRKANNLTTFMCRLSWNLGASISWNPQRLSRPVMGLLYLFYCYIYSNNSWIMDQIKTHSEFGTASMKGDFMVALK